MALDLNNIKTQIKSILDTANTTTASPVDLSSGLSTRVQRVLKVNVERIPIQASLYPCVTVFFDTKSMETETIAINQNKGVRKATIDAKIVGLTWNPNFQSVDADPPDEDLEDLMENIEEIMRANSTVNSLCTWSTPTEVSYHSGSFDEETHLRAGIMNFRMTVFYRGV